MLALISSGLTIIYGTLGVLNLAHGAMFMLGGYAGFVAFEATGSFTIAGPRRRARSCRWSAGLIELVDRPPLLCAPAGGSAPGHVRARHRARRGGAARLRQPVADDAAAASAAGVTPIGFLIYPTYRIVALAIAAVALAVLYVALYRTRLGIIVRAGIEDFAMVGMLGINVYRVFMLVFGIGAMAAGFAGIVNAPVVSLTPDMGDAILVQTFVVVVIGGVGSFPAAILGGLISGEILSLTSMVDPSYSEVMLFAVMTLVCWLRPQGLLGVPGPRVSVTSLMLRRRRLRSSL